MTPRELLHSIGLLILRTAFGGLMLVHGIPKLQNFSELADKFADPIGLGTQFSLISALGAEVGCSILLVLGLFTRLAALPLAFTMIVAAFVVHSADAWEVKEKAVLFLAAYVAIFFTGPGKVSLDHLWFGKKKIETDKA